MSETAGNISVSVANETRNGDTTSIFASLKTIGKTELTDENTETVLAEVIGSIVGNLGGDHGYIMLKDKDGQLSNVASIYRDGQDDPLITASNALTDKVLQSGCGTVVTDAMESTQFPSDPNFQRFNIKTAVCVAIATADSTLGTIYVDSTNACQWDSEQLELLEVAAIAVALAVTNMNLKKENQDDKRLAATGRATLQLSHSVKNILQMIGGAAEVVDFGLRTNEIHRVKRSWDILKPNLERMQKYTLEMLDYSKERHLELGPCDFNRVIQGAIESLKSQLKEKKSKLNIRIDQKIPTIELDSERIHEMALNLILNAIDIVDESTGVVSVETRYLVEEQEIALSISDNGPGITENMKDKIFTPFESGKNKFGTGLGMPIAKQIFDQHGGRIEIETAEGKGTTFTVLLPAKPVDGAPVAVRS